MGARREKGEINMRSAECFINYITFKLDFGRKGISSDEEGERIIVGRRNTVKNSVLITRCGHRMTRRGAMERAEQVRLG